MEATGGSQAKGGDTDLDYRLPFGAGGSSRTLGRYPRPGDSQRRRAGEDRRPAGVDRLLAGKDREPAGDDREHFGNGCLQTGGDRETDGNDRPSSFGHRRFGADRVRAGGDPVPAVAIPIEVSVERTRRRREGSRETRGVDPKGREPSRGVRKRSRGLGKRSGVLGTRSRRPEAGAERPGRRPAATPGGAGWVGWRAGGAVASRAAPLPGATAVSSRRESRCRPGRHSGPDSWGLRLSLRPCRCRRGRWR